MHKSIILLLSFPFLFACENEMTLPRPLQLVVQLQDSNQGASLHRINFIFPYEWPDDSVFLNINGVNLIPLYNENKFTSAQMVLFCAG